MITPVHCWIFALGLGWGFRPGFLRWSLWILCKWKLSTLSGWFFHLVFERFGFLVELLLNVRSYFFQSLAIFLIGRTDHSVENSLCILHFFEVESNEDNQVDDWEQFSMVYLKGNTQQWHGTKSTVQDDKGWEHTRTWVQYGFWAGCYSLGTWRCRRWECRMSKAN